MHIDKIDKYKKVGIILNHKIINLKFLNFKLNSFHKIKNK